MIEATVDLLRYRLPDDGDAARAKVLALIAGAQTSIECEMYGFADRELAEALLAAHKRGITVTLILDHTQACGPTEVALLHGILTEGFPADQITVMTSPKHAIMHRKDLIVDGAVLVTGSTNWSGQAFAKQNNDMYVLPSPALAADAIADFHTLWSWGRTNEPQYQLGAST
jgi:phosphatidylserine/phosphatidylglycerophosphate/cardiolipin synthase-like enzyme